MASAQVLPNPGASSARKQGHLEAGKRRLEEFRKKKAARKASSTGQLPSTDSEIPDRFSNEGISVQYNSDRFVNNDMEPSSLGVYESGKGNSSQLSTVDFVNGIDNATGSDDDRSGSFAPTSSKDEGHGINGSSGLPALNNVSNGIQWGGRNVLYSAKFDQISVKVQSDLDPVQSSEVTNSKSYSENANSNDPWISDNYSKSFDLSDASSSMNLFEDARSVGEQVVGVSGSSSSHTFFHANEDQFMPSKTDQERHADSMRGKISDSINRRLNVESPVMAEYSSVDYRSGFKGSSTQHSFPSRIQGNVSGRSRPSFLDSINVSRISSAPDLPADSVENNLTFSKNAYGGEVQLVSLTQQPSMKIDIKEPSVNSHDDASDDLKVSLNKDDDFAALEQHIEDLTREKFTLQRALDTSQSLAESLASENSSLTESFNQQGKVVNQLMSDMERLQDEIKAQLLAFESVKLEYTNAQLECIAADERAKILASEVINLEEKALRLRSNELKLEKQLDNSNAEIVSYKRKLSSLEKESHDFRSTIEALQEEKKLLQSKLRNASIAEKAITRSSTPTKKDVCTSTDDLGGIDEVNEAESNFLRNPVEGQGLTLSVGAGDASTSSFQDVSRNVVHPETVGTIPHDHIRMIDNINSLLSELTLEKEALMKALTAESLSNSKLKDLNKELSLKLEAQTQRFELLAAQKMAIENVPMRRVDSERINEATEYTDEGDEVVERVLGWIMKLFPGGPGKRRTRRLL